MLQQRGKVRPLLNIRRSWAFRGLLSPCIEVALNLTCRSSPALYGAGLNSSLSYRINMRIILRISLSPEQKQKLVLSEHWVLLKKVASFGGSIIDIDWPNERTKLIIETVSGSEIVIWHAYMLFDKKELTSYSFFEIEPTQIINKSRTDSALFNTAISSDLPVVKTRIHKIPSRIVVSTIKLSETSIASYGCSRELIASKYVVDILSQAQLTGLLIQDISKRDGSIHALHKRLNAKQLIEVTSFDVSTPNLISGKSEEFIAKYQSYVKHKLIPDRRKESDFFRYLGCKTLKPEEIENADDFARLGVSECSCESGWVVSKKVREVFVGNKLKGARFKPIMISGTEFHDAYLTMWHDLVALLSKHGAAYQGVPLK